MNGKRMKWLGDIEGAVVNFYQAIKQSIICKSPVQNREPAMGLGGEIEIAVHDRDGNLIRSFKQPMHTFVENAGKIIQAAFGQPCSVAVDFLIKDVLGNSYLIPYDMQANAGDYCATGGEGVDTHGIVVGTSDAAWSYTQYCLQAQITHGTGSGQLSYGATTTQLVSDTGSPAKLTLQRSFDNNSGGDITVREIGWQLVGKDDGGNPRNFMIARDVITATTVPNGGRLTVTYNILINPS